MNVKTEISLGKHNTTTFNSEPQSTLNLNYILGIITERWGMTLKQQLWYRLAFIKGGRIALRHWKTKNIIPFNKWLGEMNKIASCEQVIFRLNNQGEIFTELWGPYMNLIKNG